MISRRVVTSAGVSSFILSSAGFSACQYEDPVQVAANATFTMPTEDGRHERTFMQWPNSREVYDTRDLSKIQACIALIANKISEFEAVVMLAGEEQGAKARPKLSNKVEIWDIATEDLWCRDSGPTFVKNRDGRIAIKNFNFNGWGNKQKHVNDGQIARLIAERLNLPLIDTGLKGEQGGVEHDGNGLLMAHASCWVNTNRNAGSQQEISDALLAALGGDKMIWAPGIKGADITDYHIDALARFVGPGHVLIQLGKSVDRYDPWSVSAFETYEILKNATDASGKPLKIDIIPEPVDIRSRNQEFVASYVNYYVCNGGVISAQFGDARADGLASEMLTSFYPDRQIIALNVDPLGEAGGGIHCATQQQPKAGLI